MSSRLHALVALLVALVACATAIYFEREFVQQAYVYEKRFKADCPDRAFIKTVSSKSSNHYQDRMWAVVCYYPDKKAPNGSCTWSEWANRFDGVLDFQCPEHYGIAGFDSSHNNKFEDRRYKFKCCTIPNKEASSCAWTSYANNYDMNMTFTIPNKKVIAGWHSVFSDTYDDRLHKFYVCDYKTIR